MTAEHKLFQADAELRGQQTAGPSTSAYRAGLSVPRASSSRTNESLPEEETVNAAFKQKHGYVDDSPAHSLHARCKGRYSFILYNMYIIYINLHK